MGTLGSAPAPGGLLGSPGRARGGSAGLLTRGALPAAGSWDDYGSYGGMLLV